MRSTLVRWKTPAKCRPLVFRADPCADMRDAFADTANVQCVGIIRMLHRMDVADRMGLTHLAPFGMAHQGRRIAIHVQPWCGTPACVHFPDPIMMAALSLA